MTLICTVSLFSTELYVLFVALLTHIIECQVHIRFVSLRFFEEGGGQWAPRGPPRLIHISSFFSENNESTESKILTIPLIGMGRVKV